MGQGNWALCKLWSLDPCRFSSTTQLAKNSNSDLHFFLLIQSVNQAHTTYWAVIRVVPYAGRLCAFTPQSLIPFSRYHHFSFPCELCILSALQNFRLLWLRLFWFQPFAFRILHRLLTVANHFGPPSPFMAVRHALVQLGAFHVQV